MELGVLKARWKCATNGPKIIQIGWQLFVGDQFQQCYLEASEAHDSVILYIHVQKKEHIILFKKIQVYIMG